MNRPSFGFGDTVSAITLSETSMTAVEVKLISLDASKQPDDAVTTVL
jgi:hypothetical protein